MGNETLNWDGLMTIMCRLAQRRVRSFRKKNRAFNILRFNDALHIVLNEKYSLLQQGNIFLESNGSLIDITVFFPSQCLNIVKGTWEDCATSRTSRCQIRCQ